MVKKGHGSTYERITSNSYSRVKAELEMPVGIVFRPVHQVLGARRVFHRPMAITRIRWQNLSRWLPPTMAIRRFRFDIPMISSNIFEQQVG
jgi:hypothetical protein